MTAVNTPTTNDRPAAPSEGGLTATSGSASLAGD
jgi:hypothetical protein